MTDPRVVWLMARLLRLEQLARQAEGKAVSPWSSRDGMVVASTTVTFGAIHPVAEFIAANDPRSVVARVESDRALMKIHTPGNMEYFHDWNHTNEPHDEDAPDGGCVGCVNVTECPECSCAMYGVAWPCASFKTVLWAHRYADGFQVEWLEARRGSL